MFKTAMHTLNIILYSPIISPESDCELAVTLAYSLGRAKEGTQGVRGEALEAQRFWSFACIHTVAKWYPDQWAPDKATEAQHFCIQICSQRYCDELFFTFSHRLFTFA